MRRQLDRLLAEAVADDRVPGVAAGVANAGGVLYEGGFGRRSIQGDVALTVDTVFNIASMTKAVTGAAVMQLVERGELGLDAPAGDIIPYLGEVQVLAGFDAAGQPRLRTPNRAVTLRHLLSHTSGFTYEIWNEDAARYIAAVDHPNALSGTVRSLQMPLMFDPGSAWEYGTGIDWAGLMLEAVTGRTLPEYFSSELFEPLGMVDTGHVPHESAAARTAAIHARVADGFQVFDFPSNPSPEFYSGGAGLYSTAPDYLRFLRMILNYGQLDGVRVLQPETVQQMSVNSIGDNRVRPLRSVNSTLSRDVELFPGLHKTWGLTFQINEAPAPTGRSAGGLSWAGLFNCYFWIDPVLDVAGVFMTQILPFGDVEALPMFERFETAVYQALGR